MSASDPAAPAAATGAVSVGTRLLPCPCCGSEAQVDEPEEGAHCATCSKCGLTTKLYYACGDDPMPLIVDAWNARVANHKQIRAIQEQLTENACIRAQLTAQSAECARLREDVSSIEANRTECLNVWKAAFRKLGMQPCESIDTFVERLTARLAESVGKADLERVIGTKRDTLTAARAYELLVADLRSLLSRRDGGA